MKARNMKKRTKLISDCIVHASRSVRTLTIRLSPFPNLSTSLIIHAHALGVALSLRQLGFLFGLVAALYQLNSDVSSRNRVLLHRPHPSVDVGVLQLQGRTEPPDDAWAAVDVLRLHSAEHHIEIFHLFQPLLRGQVQAAAAQLKKSFTVGTSSARRALARHGAQAAVHRAELVGHVRLPLPTEL